MNYNVSLSLSLMYPFVIVISLFNSSTNDGTDNNNKFVIATDKRQ